MNSQAKTLHNKFNKLIKLDNTMLMYRIYNAETLEKLINTVQDIHNVTSFHEKLFAGEYNPTIFRLLYMNALGIQQYAFNSLLFLRVVQDKYISLYKGLITQLRSYGQRLFQSPTRKQTPLLMSSSIIIYLSTCAPNSYCLTMGQNSRTN